MVKGAGNALGLSGVFRDLGLKYEIVLYTDSSAAKGISSRRGLGKLRHVELNELWLQDQVARGREDRGRRRKYTHPTNMFQHTRPEVRGFNI